MIMDLLYPVQSFIGFLLPDIFNVSFVKGGKISFSLHFIFEGLVLLAVFFLMIKWKTEG